MQLGLIKTAIIVLQTAKHMCKHANHATWFDYKDVNSTIQLKMIKIAWLTRKQHKEHLRNQA